MDHAEAEAHLPPVVLPELNGEVLPNYERVALQDLQPGSFYYLGGTGAAGPNGAFFAGPMTNNFLVEYEGAQDDTYIFTFYKTRSKVPLGPWIDDMEQGLDFSIANLQYGGLRFYIYQPGMNLGNSNMEGGAYKPNENVIYGSAIFKDGRGGVPSSGPKYAGGHALQQTVGPHRVRRKRKTRKANKWKRSTKRRHR
jgi:hypothetical protein